MNICTGWSPPPPPVQVHVAPSLPIIAHAQLRSNIFAPALSEEKGKYISVH